MHCFSLRFCFEGWLLYLISTVLLFLQVPPPPLVSVGCRWALRRLFSAAEVKAEVTVAEEVVRGTKRLMPPAVKVVTVLLRAA